ncbi:MAG TPA: hypothetical protein VGQ44_11320 [Gemmatimonadaceae bacterium]|jgi:hypothetical protein|nr:hypothetical protein [Gemmatimonadaceae bacterium]
MPDRDWEKELAKIDKQLASLPDEALMPAAPDKQAKGAAVPARGGRPAASAPAESKSTTSFGVFARLTLALAVGIAMAFWPYPSRCGVGLIGYLGAVGVMTAGGVWASIWTWRHRASRAHLVSLAITVWGVLLGSLEILPRIGYAYPTDKHPAGWSCSAVPTKPQPAPVQPAPTSPAPSPTTAKPPAPTTKP